MTKELNKGDYYLLWGKTWEVVGLTKRDGELAVRLRSTNNKKVERSDFFKTFTRLAVKVDKPITGRHNRHPEQGLGS